MPVHWQDIFFVLSGINLVPIYLRISGSLKTACFSCYFMPSGHVLSYQDETFPLSVLEEGEKSAWFSTLIHSEGSTLDPGDPLCSWAKGVEQQAANLLRLHTHSHWPLLHPGTNPRAKPSIQGCWIPGATHQTPPRDLG